MNKEFPNTKFGTLVLAQPKSHIKAGEGKAKGSFPFFTSSPIQNKYVDECTYQGPALIFGTGGGASVHICEGTFATSTDCLVYYPVNKNLCMKYLYRYLQGNIHILQRGFKGAGLQHISKTYIENLDIPFPDINVQKRIAERLDKVQELIALQKEQLAKLDDLIKSRFIDLFGDPITNPKGWPLKRMGDLYYLKAGQTTKANVIHPYSEDYSVPCYGGNGIRGYVQTSTYEGIFPIIGRQGALCGNIQLASGKFHATEHAVLVTPLKGDQPLYVYHLLKDMNLYRFHGGAAQPGLAVKTLNEINIIDVPHNLQTQFADFVAKIETQKGLLTTRLSHLETLYKSLMQEYFG